ncbi:acetate--CoA ligase [Candidatus Woesearchaeota archaeon]|nr:acetate--CoA ligase [Candidatus Woesearchaeota archaeon]
MAKKIFLPPKEFAKKAHIKSYSEYKKLYNESVKSPEKFWARYASELHWFKKWNRVFSYTKKPFCKWFEGGKTNITYNCLDRHVLTARKNKAAIIWQGEPEEDVMIYTYERLHRDVCRFANVLKKHGVKKGDRVCIYMPMVPGLAIAMLACARIGAIHSIVFGGFSAKALQKRLIDSEAKVLITADASIRKGGFVPLKDAADEALKGCKTVKSVIVYQRGKNPVKMKRGRDSWWHEEMAAPDITDICKPAIMDAESPLFILYTSGTTGTPKGELHTTGGYMTYVYLTTKWVFDLKEEDTYWCTADIGWITGHSYIVYGPLLNGATSIMFEGVPTYPGPDRFWQIVDKYNINIFYTAPTVVRSLEREGPKWVKMHDLSSLRLLGSVGEPINPKAWLWYHKMIGEDKCPIVDTWWQTEAGGIVITPLPGATPLKPGSATLPFPGIVPDVFLENGKKAKPNQEGYLVIKKPWPGIARTVWKNPKRYIDTYFSKYKNIYLTGDGARCDKDGYYWITGRLDDVMKVSGHRIGTAEVESGFVSHKLVSEAAVVPFPHPIKEQAICAFITLKRGAKESEELKQELRSHIAKEIGPIAKPDRLYFTDALPKTRSGKIMRRILKAIAEGKSDVGDTSTLADPEVVGRIIKIVKAKA